jgi:hypothetical protein
VVSVEGNGSVVARSPALTCADQCTFTLPEGTLVTLTARPGLDSVFGQWSGCATPCQLRMDGERRIVAVFRFPLLQVSVEGKARGSVRSTPAGIACPPACEASFTGGTPVTLAPSPEGRAAFVGWTDGCAGFDPCVFTIRNDVAATARFETLAPEYSAAVRECPRASPIRARHGETATIDVCFENAGRATWDRGKPSEVELAQCCPFGGPSPLFDWLVDKTSKSVYADVTTPSVPRGSIGMASFQISVPANADLRDHRIHGFLVLASSGAPVAGGAFSVVVTVIR